MNLNKTPALQAENERMFFLKEFIFSCCLVLSLGSYHVITQESVVSVGFCGFLIRAFVNSLSANYNCPDMLFHF